MSKSRWRNPITTVLFATILICASVGIGLPASAATANPWSAPSNIITTSNSISSAQVVEDSSGNLTATWLEYVVSVYLVKASTKAPGGSWSTAETISPAGKSADSSNLIIDNAGNITATWRVTESSGYTIQAATKTSTGSWSAPANVSAVGQATSGTSLVVDGSGNVTAVWSFNTGSGRQLYGSTKPLAGVWSSASVVSSLVASYIQLPDLVVDTQGTVTAVWAQSDSYNSVFSATMSQGVWTSPHQLPVAGSNTYGSQVTIDGDGTVIAMWTYDPGPNSITQSSTKPIGGAWSTPTTETGLGSNFYISNLVSDVRGNLTVLGSDYSGSEIAIHAASRIVGEPWSAISILSDPSSEANYSQIVLDTSGNAVAVWAWGGTHTFPNTIVQSSTLPLGGTWSGSVDVSSVSNPSVFPSLRMGTTGQALLSWAISGNNTNSVVYSTMSWNYTLAYGANSGSGAVPTSQVGASGIVMNVAGASSLSRSGYTFSGWNTRADGTGIAYAEGSSISLTADTTLYAQWTPALAATGSTTGIPEAALGGLAVLCGAGILLSLRRRSLR